MIKHYYLITYYVILWLVRLKQYHYIVNCEMFVKKLYAAIQQTVVLIGLF